MTRSLEFLTLRLVCTEPLAIHQLQLRFPALILIPVEVSSHGFCSSKFWLSVSACLPNFGGSIFPCNLNSLTDVRKVNVNFFSVCLVIVRME